MKDMMQYKGYYGSVHYSGEDQIFFGKIEYIRSLVSYEGSDVKSLKQAFEEAVEDYLELCKNEDVEPDQPFKGSFNVRTGSDLHRKAALYAREKGLNLNNVVTEALEKYLSHAHST
ncbi:MAG: type II toxin-antitoxin system HicB family antitoxin [Anaerolineaceae bacterium]|nr:type II toxin-antitoxin system HicB family antitoxin [Anaerolineaceae bacterium]